MKKTFLFLFCLGMAASASAQFTDNSSSSSSSPSPNPTTGTTAAHSVNTVDELVFSRVVLSYSPTTRVMEKGTDKTKYNMLALGWVADRAVASFPLYVEFGLGANWYFAQEKDNGETQKFNLVSLSIPVNISYRLSLCNGKMHLAPYAGIYFRYNFGGHWKYEYDGGSKKTDLFNEKDMGGEDYVWKHFQMGWQGGLAFDFNKFFCHVGYTRDFLSLTKKNSSEFAGASFGIGFLF